jgi:hypothetical protein
MQCAPAQDLSLIWHLDPKKILLCILASGQLSASASPLKLTVTSGEGESATYKRGLLGDKKTEIEDRIGDKFEQKRGIFGLTKDTQVGVLGSNVRYHKGILGNSAFDAQSWLGDKIKYRRNAFGWRNANINLSGSAGFVSKLFNETSDQPASSVPEGQPTQTLSPFASMPVSRARAQNQAQDQEQNQARDRTRSTDQGDLPLK